MGDDKKDEFTIFLVVGLMVLAILLAVFNYSAAPIKVQHTGRVIQEIPAARLAGAVPVGPEQIARTRTFSFSFEASNLRESKDILVGDHIVESGVLFGEKDVVYQLSLIQPSQLTISFRVIKTNELEPLIIRINGETAVADRFAPGEYVIPISPRYLSDEMRISFTAASSGWQIWAPTRYELADVTLHAEGYAIQGWTYVFPLADELDNITFAKLDLTLRENIGRLNISLNNRQFSLGVPATVAAIQINPRDLIEGDNILTLVPESDSSFAGTGVLTIQYTQPRMREFRTPLNLTNDEYARMNETVIRFAAVRVARPGGLAFHIENRNGITFREFAPINGDQYFAIVIPRQALAPGLNVVSIDSIDSAIFTVANFEVNFR